MKRNTALALAAAVFLLAGAALAAPTATSDTSSCPALQAAAPAAPAAQTAEPLWLADGKCASCSDLLKSCKAFCGNNNVNFNCQNSSPCAGTCTCIVPPGS
jgi:hypothetical protein